MGIETGMEVEEKWGRGLSVGDVGVRVDGDGSERVGEIGLVGDGGVMEDGEGCTAERRKGGRFWRRFEGGVGLSSWFGEGLRVWGGRRLGLEEGALV
ncbi:uncharacterized protein G2W53_007759 [Senna tora]|uniref:Uncharacterized protein n=1 Tax=Senna tora TaxID=362788 RepID=A0A834X7K9_9FABA|nr:uncharacterized protein G2W53_007759 [Senna tora]